MNKTLACLIYVLLIQSCSRINRFSPEEIFETTSAISLAKSIEKNDLSGIRRNEESINVVGRYDITPLLWAVKRDGVLPQTASEVVSMGGDPFFISKMQKTSPMEDVIKYRDDEYFRVFIQKVKDVDHYTGNKLEPTALFTAIVARAQGKVADLLSKGASVNVRNTDGDTPLLFAKANQFSIAIALIRKGANMRAVNGRGNGVCGLFGTPVNNLNASALKARAALLGELSHAGVECPDRSA